VAGFIPDSPTVKSPETDSIFVLRQSRRNNFMRNEQI
jgi:hypothetical protein